MKLASSGVAIGPPWQNTMTSGFTDCHGFYGASSMERLPTEVALTETTRRFTQITR